MSLELPGFIDVETTIDPPITHDWDDDDPELVYGRLDQRLQHKIGKTSDRGQLVLSCGFAEWIAWRMKQHCDDPMFFNKIEAVYAAVIDWRYMNDRKLPKRAEWQGPVLGPQWAAAKLLNQMTDLIKRKQFASPESVSLTFLDLHVLPDPEPYKTWRRLAITRLAKTHPLDLEQPLGAPVARESLDPNVDYDPCGDLELLAEFLTKIDPSTNPFLATPEEMIRAGFEGTPYSL